jgi:hypothetical protein
LSQGAPAGNQNAKKGKAWSDAIRRAIREKYKGEDYEAKLAQLAKKLVEAADGGDMAALKEIGDRHDGKPAQSVALGNDGDEPFKVEKIVREIVRPPVRNG